MKLGDLLSPPQALGSSRFVTVSYLPTLAVLLFLLVLIWAGAPGARLSFTTAWQRAASLTAGQIFLLAVAVILLAVVLLPLQLALVRLIEGRWPAWLGSGLLRRWHLRRKAALEKAATLPQPVDGLTAEQIRRAGVAGTRLRQRYPLDDHLVRPTALGNALAAMDDSAGRGYGVDSVVAWPRLYLVLGDRAKAVVDDRRDAMDAAARMAASAAVATVGAAALLWNAGLPWWLLVAAPASIAVAAYGGAVQAAIAYGQAVHVAFDVHRFDLLKALRIDLPDSPDAEVAIYRQLSDHWRQGVPLSLAYNTAEQE